ncbi:hypothetical protein D9M73_210640 [compost metagenome]
MLVTSTRPSRERVRALLAPRLMAISKSSNINAERWKNSVLERPTACSLDRRLTRSAARLIKRTRPSPSQTMIASPKLSSRACSAGVSSKAPRISLLTLTDERMPICRAPSRFLSFMGATLQCGRRVVRCGAALRPARRRLRG